MLGSWTITASSDILEWMLWRRRGTCLLVMASAGALGACGSGATGAGRDVAATVPSTTSSGDPTTTTEVRLDSVGEFAVSPTNVTVGDPITFSGSGCPPKNRVNVSLGGGGSVTSGTYASQLHPNAVGDWTVTVDVADGTLLGRQAAGAACLPPPFNGLGAISYRPVTVVVDSFRRLNVTPTSVPAGSAITVTPTAPCDSGFPAGIQVAIFADLPVQGPTNIAVGASDLDANGNWTQVIVVPANTTPGTYIVKATCAGPSRSYNAFYMPASMEVLGTQAASPGSPEPEIPRTR